MLVYMGYQTNTTSTIACNRLGFGSYETRVFAPRPTTSYRIADHNIEHDLS